jgi:hypothetical protein
MHYPYHFPHDGSWFFWFSEHYIIELVLEGSWLETKLEGHVIFPTIWMQLHHLVQSLTRTHWMFSQTLERIRLVSFTCFQANISSVSDLSVGCPPTFPKSHRLWPICAILFPLPLSSFACCCQYLLDPRLSHYLPITRYWLKESAIPWVFRASASLWFLTASSWSQITRENICPPLQTHWGLIDIVWHWTSQSSSYIGCVSSRWRHQSVISGIHNVLLIFLGWEW